MPRNTYSLVNAHASVKAVAHIQCSLHGVLGEIGADQGREVWLPETHPWQRPACIASTHCRLGLTEVHAGAAAHATAWLGEERDKD